LRGDSSLCEERHAREKVGWDVSVIGRASLYPRRSLSRCAGRETEWARQDAIALLDAVALQVLSRMLRVDEERGVKAGSGDKEEGKSSKMPHPVAFSSSPAGELHAGTPPPTSLPATPSDNDNEYDAGAVPSNLSPLP
jgi:hypothetical protein